jgi:hypothetical protein
MLVCISRRGFLVVGCSVVWYLVAEVHLDGFPEHVCLREYVHGLLVHERLLIAPARVLP